MISVLETPRSTQHLTLTDLAGRTGVVHPFGPQHMSEMDAWGRLRRFLILGTDHGTYHAGRQDLTALDADAVTVALQIDGLRVVAEIVAVSDAGRSVSSESVILALAMAAATDDELARRAALAAVPRVAKSGDDLFRFATHVQALRGWGRGLRRAVAAWYNTKDPATLVSQVITFRQRDGWTHADLLRLGHPKAATPAHDTIYKWIVDGTLPEGGHDGSDTAALTCLAGFVGLQKATIARDAVTLIQEHRLPLGVVPMSMMIEPAVWDALLPDMPLPAMLRNLSAMSHVGLLTPSSDAARIVVTSLLDGDRLLQARLHPLTVLSALNGYAQGHDDMHGHVWTPVPAVLDALDAAFYAAFGNVRPSGKRVRVTLDVSQEMEKTIVAGVPFVSARDVSAVMALITARIEPDHEIMAYGDTLVPVAISPRHRLDDVITTLRTISAGNVSTAAPVRDALLSRGRVDAFINYTHGEARGGDIPWPEWSIAHGQEVADGLDVSCLQEYRNATGISVRQAVVALSARDTYRSGPADAGRLDIIGFDANTPEILRGFIRGEV